MNKHIKYINTHISWVIKGFLFLCAVLFVWNINSSRSLAMPAYADDDSKEYIEYTLTEAGRIQVYNHWGRKCLIYKINDGRWSLGYDTGITNMPSMYDSEASAGTKIRITYDDDVDIIFNHWDQFDPDHCPCITGAKGYISHLPSKSVFGNSPYYEECFGIRASATNDTSSYVYSGSAIYPKNMVTVTYPIVSSAYTVKFSKYSNKGFSTSMPAFYNSYGINTVYYQIESRYTSVRNCTGSYTFTIRGLSRMATARTGLTYIGPEDIDEDEGEDQEQYGYSGESNVRRSRGDTCYQTYPGTYTTYLVPYDYCSWEDTGTTEERSVTFTISPQTVPVPTAATGFVYDGNYKTGVAESVKYNRIGNYYENNAGDYQVFVSLLDPAYYKWSDGTTVVKTLNWSIDRKPIAVPSAKTNLVYNGTEQTGVNSGTGYTVTGNKGTNAKSDYVATVTPTSNYKWNSGSDVTGSRTIMWAIAKANSSVTLNATSKSVAYGTTGTVTITAHTGDGSYSVSRVSGSTVTPSISGTTITLTPTGVGSNTVRVTIGQTANYNSAYADVSVTTANGTITCTVTNPSAGTYNRSAQTAPDGVSNISPSGATITYKDRSASSYTSARPQYTSAGTYTIDFKISKDNYNDKTGSYTWTINPKTITAPSAVSGLIYNGSEQTGVSSADTNAYAVANGKGTNAGNYTATATLTSTSNYKWNDNTTTAKSIGWSIARKGISVPSGTNRTWDGSKQTGVASSTEYTRDGDYEGTNAGNYTASVTPTANYQWSSGSDTTGARSVSWTMLRAGIAAPSAKTGLVYNGSLQTGVNSGDYYTITGNTGTNAGSYTAKATPDSNHQWSSGSDITLARDITWSIARKPVPKPVTHNFTYDGTEKAGITGSGEGYTLTGTIKATNAGNYAADAELDNNHCWED